MDLREALRGTGSVRAFTDEPVAHATLFDILDDARFAPSGGNRQGWRVAVVEDPSRRRRLADLMSPVWSDYLAEAATGVTPFNVVVPVPDHPPAEAMANPLLDDIEHVPVVLAVAIDLARVSMMDFGNPTRPPVVGGASIYPFCWSIVLAARARGLGGVLTTFMSRAEAEAGPELGLPPGHALAATVFLGHPVHQPTKLTRNAVASFATIDRFDGPPLAAG